MFRANGYILKDLLGHDSDESRVHSLQRFSTLLRNIQRYNVPLKFLCSHTGFEPAMDIIIIFIITVIMPREKSTLTEGKSISEGESQLLRGESRLKGGGGGWCDLITVLPVIMVALVVIIIIIIIIRPCVKRFPLRPENNLQLQIL